MRRSVPLFLTAALTLLLAGCGGPPPVELASQTLEVGCARCIFEVPETQGCPWAVEIDGIPHLLYGPVPRDHQSHGPDGICNMRRKAVVAGRIHDGKVVANAFELLPAEGIPESPRFTPEDVH